MNSDKKEVERLRYIIVTVMLGVAISIAAANRFTLVIDAGHGGADAGAIGNGGVKEKNLTLKFALAFGKLVETNCPDVKVIYTRKTDKFVELYKRAEIANQNKADLFISVHINSVPKGHVARGFQTYTLGKSRRTGKKTGVLENLEVAKRENAVILKEKNYQNNYQGFDPNSPESSILFELIQDKNMANSIQLAKYMQQYMCAATGRQDKGVHQDNLAVLRLSSMPACLLELGFISTADEEQYLISDRAVAAFSRGFYHAFVAYKNKVAPGLTVPYKPLPEPSVKAEKPDKPASPESPESPESPASPAGPEKPEQPEPQGSAEAPAAAEVPAAPVFKVQLLASTVRLKKNSPQLKGVADADCYEEGGLYKYTVGDSTDYQAVNQLCKSLHDRFPQAFIIAFKDGSKVNVGDAIREYKANKNKK
mgnify:CR=1 FL=1